MTMELSSRTIRLARINVFPVKSLPGIAQRTARITANGSLFGDRIHRLVVKRTDENEEVRVVKAKGVPRLIPIQLVHHSSARFALEGFGDAFIVPMYREGVEAALSTFVGTQIQVETQQLGGFPDDTEAHGPTIVSVETLREVARWFGTDVENIRRRFRANLELESSSELPPFWEDLLVAGNDSLRCFKIGGVEFNGAKLCLRCRVPAHDPLTGNFDPTFASVFATNRRASVVEGVDPRHFGKTHWRLAVNTTVDPASLNRLIHVGDALTFADA